MMLVPVDAIAATDSSSSSAEGGRSGLDLDDAARGDEELQEHGIAPNRGDNHGGYMLEFVWRMNAAFGLRLSLVQN